MGPSILVWVEIKGLCLWQRLPTWRDGAENRIVRQTKVSASLESATKGTRVWTPLCVLTGVCFWDRHPCRGAPSQGVASSAFASRESHAGVLNNTLNVDVT